MADRAVAGLAELAGRGRTLVMGVVNVTPDSFSDGGQWFEPGAAMAHGLELMAQGADLIDIGGESTRPGAGRVPEETEAERVLPVIRELAGRGAVVSVDTTRSRVAEAAVAAGARLVNDVSGGLADPGMAAVVARTGVAYVCMHWRGPSDVMDALEDYGDVVADVRGELAERVGRLRSAGVRDEQIVVDPGLGFSKAGAANWPLLTHLDALAELGYPVLVGASRKRFLGHLLADEGGEPVPPRARDGATAAVTALAAARGAWCVRVHEIPANLAAVRVAAAWSNTLDSTGPAPTRKDDQRTASARTDDGRPRSDRSTK